MELMEVILSSENMNKAYKKVVSNKGAAGVDNVKVDELADYIKTNKDKIMHQLRTRTYHPMPVKRVYIPKQNGKKRPLGIPTALDRVIQQSISQPISEKYEKVFSEYSYGFRPNRSCHTAIEKALEYLNEGFEWIIDIDIEKFFDKVNHDKLISILREQVNESDVLNLIRKYLKAGVMDDGIISKSTIGVPQGGPLSVILSNVYLDKLDKELESRGLRFVRYADDVVIFVKSELAANRVLNSISNWIERKLFLKVNAEKSKVVKPPESKFLGFTFINYKGKWNVKPTNEKKLALFEKFKKEFKRNKACAMSLEYIFKRTNQILVGWINYFKIGMMKSFMSKFGKWLRHKIRIIIVKQWKTPKTKYRNLMYLRNKYKLYITDETIRIVANARLGLYKQTLGIVYNIALGPKILETSIKNRPGLINPLNYYLR